MHEEVLKLHTKGKMSLSEIANTCGMVKSTVASIVRRHRQNRQLSQTGRQTSIRKKLDKEDRAVLSYHVNNSPGITLKGLRALFLKDGILISVPTLSRTLREIGYRKKGHYYVRSVDDEEDHFTIGLPSDDLKDDIVVLTDWFPPPLTKAELHPDSFKDVPIPSTASGARLAMKSLCCTVRNLRLTRKDYPSDAKKFVSSFLNVLSDGLLPITHVLNAYDTERISLQLTSREKKGWQWRLLCAVENSEDGLACLYRLVGPKRSRCAFQTVLNGLLTAAAIEKGYADVFDWEEGMELQRSKRRPAGAKGGRKRWKIHNARCPCASFMTALLRSERDIQASTTRNLPAKSRPQWS